MGTSRLDQPLIFGVAFLVVMVPLASSAQQRPTAPAASAITPAAPQRTETIVYDSWTVTCRDEVGKSSKRDCLASFTAVDENKRQILNWVVTRNQNGAAVSIIQVPQIQAGILLEKGLQVKIGSGAARKLDYIMCGPNQCQASMPMDNVMIKELLSAQAAVVTITSAAGQEVNINIANMKGADKAVGAIGR